MKRLIIIPALLLGGCAQVSPLIEAAHVSHAVQHIDKNISYCSPNCGANIFSGGIRWRPSPGLTIDLLDGYSPERLHGQKEVFTSRMTWEIRR